MPVAAQVCPPAANLRFSGDSEIASLRFRRCFQPNLNDVIVSVHHLERDPCRQTLKLNLGLFRQVHFLEVEIR